MTILSVIKELKKIAGSIRNKGATSDKMLLSEMSPNIDKIQTWELDSYIGKQAVLSFENAVEAVVIDENSLYIGVAVSEVPA